MLKTLNKASCMLQSCRLSGIWLVSPVRLISSKADDGIAEKDKKQKSGRKGKRQGSSRLKVDEHSKVSKKLVTDKKQGDAKNIVDVFNKRDYLLVPTVASTDHVPLEEIATEELFARYRPLFLGNSILDTDRHGKLLDKFFSSLKDAGNIIVDIEHRSVEVNFQDLLKVLKTGSVDIQKWKHADSELSWKILKHNPMYPEPPIDESLLNQSDSRSRSIKQGTLGRAETASSFQPKSFKTKFHNSKINDEIRVIDLYRPLPKYRLPKPKYATTSPDIVAMSENKYETERKNMSEEFKFIMADERILRNSLEKLTKFVCKEFHKLSKLQMSLDIPDFRLPLYIYVEKSIQSRNNFRSFLRNTLINYIRPLLLGVSQHQGSLDRAKKFNNRVHLKINSMVKDLSVYLPSVNFSGDTVTCLFHSSPVPAFGRMYWLKHNKRHLVFRGKRSHNNLFYNASRYHKWKGTGYIRYPAVLHWETFKQAFKEWDHFT
ncbi:Mrx6p Ecym_3527 [Eremothecium cymbalariae DBVPG|uniref:Uncharacterized protein n=1 Tax=Eremothecium cymbalariae (strain CBS 270.75 / DBVPG 7215 / KCTC 17166 / NRRL Y-17582) TaxID=931890 RepID=G8JQM1_ERECY|nr:Hypothetical protein Ecym_3527 [Eremothecium cymbalariae DBVPG\